MGLVWFSAGLHSSPLKRHLPHARIGGDEAVCPARLSRSREWHPRPCSCQQLVGGAASPVAGGGRLGPGRGPATPGGTPARARPGLRWTGAPPFTRPGRRRERFGAAYDELAQAATVVVPDLLGFGGSMDATGPTDAQAHIAALDAALTALGLQDRPTIVAGHSMGGVLAIRWAAAHRDRVRAVLTSGAPLYRNRAEADAHIGAIGPMEALLAGDGPLPRAACAWMCRHRSAASWLAVAYRPDLPIPVARSGVKHTWDTYSGAMDGLIRDDGWLPALDALDRIPLTLAAGDYDPVPVPGRAAELARARPTLRSVVHPQADHGLPLTHPDWCRQLVSEALTIQPG
nr:alpha/beta hydrolase [Blastococcus sp. DSM 46786]